MHAIEKFESDSQLDRHYAERACSGLKVEAEGTDGFTWGTVCLITFYMSVQTGKKNKKNSPNVEKKVDNWN